jgi:hypothetical protein
MIKNPERSSRGGDVEGSEMTDVDDGLGPACSVASASFDPGYDIETSLCDASGAGFCTVADMKRGFTGYGVSVGDKRGKGYL